MSGTSYVIAGVALNRAARGEPLRVALGGVPVPLADKLVSPSRAASDERAKVVAYLHGLADSWERVAAGSVNQGVHDVAVSTLRGVARNIETGEHWK